MADIMDGSFRTKSKGDDSALIWVKLNSGASKPMRHAKKRCLDDVAKWSSAHSGKLPSEEEWLKDSKRFSLETIENLFGSFSAMLTESEKRQRPITARRNRAEVKVTQITGDELEALHSEILPKPKNSRCRIIDSDQKRRFSRRYSDEILAENLLQACHDGKEYITVTQYTAWQTSQDKSDEIPTAQTIKTHLGEGSWSEAMFTRAREIFEAKEEFGSSEGSSTALPEQH